MMPSHNNNIALRHAKSCGDFFQLLYSLQIYRVRGGAVPWEGRVEVKLNGEWGTICDEHWDIVDAHVACKSLGYGSAKMAYYRGSNGRGVGKIHYTQLGYANCLRGI